MPDCLEKWNFGWWIWGQLLREQETQKNLEEYESEDRSLQWGENCPIFVQKEPRKQTIWRCGHNTNSFEELSIKFLEIFSIKCVNTLFLKSGLCFCLITTFKLFKIVHHKIYFFLLCFEFPAGARPTLLLCGHQSVTRKPVSAPTLGQCHLLVTSLLLDLGLYHTWMGSDLSGILKIWVNWPAICNNRDCLRNSSFCSLCLHKSHQIGCGHYQYLIKPLWRQGHRQLKGERLEKE